MHEEISGSRRLRGTESSFEPAPGSIEELRREHRERASIGIGTYRRRRLPSLDEIENVSRH